MRVLFTSIRNTGHFNPLVPLIEACRKRGHEVGVAGSAELREPAEKSGATFFEVDHPGDEALKPIWAKLQTLSPEEANRVVVGEIFARMNGSAALPKLLKAIESWRPQVVVRESSEFAGAVAAEARNLPHARVGITLSMFDCSARGYAATATQELRALAGLPPDPSGQTLSRAPYLTFFPRSLEDPEVPGVEGALRFQAPIVATEPLPAEWWGGREGPLVYVTFGSVAGSMPPARAAFRSALDAVSTLDVRVLLTTGMGTDIDALGPIPANVHVERWVPQQRALAEAKAVICHGGSGTTLGALAAGVPLVVVPLFADQPQNARRVAAVGAGLAVEGRPLQAEQIRAALSRVLEEESFRDGARAIATEMASLAPIDSAVDVLERLRDLV